jgi:thymidylate kinase
MNDYIKHIGLNLSVKSKSSRKLYRIDNSDGTPRWIWNAENHNPDFLRFYSVSGTKARFFALLVKLVFSFRLQSLVFGRNFFHVDEDQSHALNHLVSGNFALFTGTEGPNRKLVLYSGKHFIKIALSESSAELIRNEMKMLKEIKNGCYFTIPEATYQGIGILALTDLGLGHKRFNEFTSLHATALTELSNIVKVRSVKFRETVDFYNVTKQLTSLQIKKHPLIPLNLIDKLTRLAEQIADQTLIHTVAHRDFTPWNCFVSRQKLYLYDFELAQTHTPYAYDAFHFVLQNGILVDRIPWKAIEPKLRAAYKLLCESAGLKDIGFEQYFRAYMVINVAYYMDLYSRQEIWHTQISWLLSTWNDAMSSLLHTAEAPRELLIGDVFDFLQAREYAALKFPYMDPKKLSIDSDIDFLMEKPLALNLLSFLQQHSLVKRISIQRQSNMLNALILITDGNLLSIDLVWQLKRKSLEFMHSREVLSRTSTNDFAVKTLSDEDTLSYLQCFYGLNHSKIPEKYHIYFSAESDLTPDNQKLKALVKNMKANKGYSSFYNKANYFFDCFYRFAQRRGMIITFSGVDGAGKSTIIEHTRWEIEKKLRRRVVVIRHRPSLLPILSAIKYGKAEAELKAAGTLPRMGSNKNLISSLLRFSYYYMDYFFGQFYVYGRHVLIGNVVLYDRYYFDFINDSVRSNIHLPKWLTKAGYRLLMKPTLNFFLYADPEIILERKKELEPHTIVNLTQDYLQLFNELGKYKKYSYFPIENVHLSETVNLITNKAKIILV